GNISWNWNSGMACPRGKRPKTAKSVRRLLLSEAVELDDLRGGHFGLGLGVVLGLGRRFGLVAGRRAADRRALFGSRQRRRRGAGHVGLFAGARLVLAIELQAEAHRGID